MVCIALLCYSFPPVKKVPFLRLEREVEEANAGGIKQAHSSTKGCNKPDYMVKEVASTSHAYNSVTRQLMHTQVLMYMHLLCLQTGAPLIFK